MYDAGVRNFEEALAPLIPRIEADRRLPREAVEVLVAAGVYKLFVPTALGGRAASTREAVELIEALSRVDGSIGWCAMIGATSSLMWEFLDPATAREIYGPADAITSAVFAPMGKAVADGDSYRVTGRWSFASGCEHAQWRMAGAIADGKMISVMLRADQMRIEDTWTAFGMRGTGSHDFVVEDAVVPRARTFQLAHGFGAIAACLGAVGLGLGRAAIDAFSASAKTKKLPGGKRTVADRELIQAEVARAEMRMSAARAFLLEQADGNDRVRIRLAATNACEAGAEVATAMFRAGGGSAVYAHHPLQRILRDAQVAAQHLMVSSIPTVTAGRVLLGLEADTSTF